MFMPFQFVPHYDFRYFMQKRASSGFDKIAVEIDPNNLSEEQLRDIAFDLGIDTRENLRAFRGQKNLWREVVQDVLPEYLAGDRRGVAEKLRRNTPFITNNEGQNWASLFRTLGDREFEVFHAQRNNQDPSFYGPGFIDPKKNPELAKKMENFNRIEYPRTSQGSSDVIYKNLRKSELPESLRQEYMQMVADKVKHMRQFPAYYRSLEDQKKMDDLRERRRPEPMHYLKEEVSFPEHNVDIGGKESVTPGEYLTSDGLINPEYYENIVRTTHNHPTSKNQITYGLMLKKLKRRLKRTEDPATRRLINKQIRENERLTSPIIFNRLSPSGLESRAWLDSSKNKISNFLNLPTKIPYIGGKMSKYTQALTQKAKDTFDTYFPNMMGADTEAFYKTNKKNPKSWNVILSDDAQFYSGSRNRTDGVEGIEYLNFDRRPRAIRMNPNPTYRSNFREYARKERQIMNKRSWLDEHGFYKLAALFE
jgi:hypothetical protein